MRSCRLCHRSRCQTRSLTSLFGKTVGGVREVVCSPDCADSTALVALPCLGLAISVVKGGLGGDFVWNIISTQVVGSSVYRHDRAHAGAEYRTAVDPDLRS